MRGKTGLGISVGMLVTLVLLALGLTLVVVRRQERRTAAASLVMVRAEREAGRATGDREDGTVSRSRVVSDRANTGEGKAAGPESVAGATAVGVAPEKNATAPVASAGIEAAQSGASASSKAAISPDWARMARAQMARPTDFAKLTAELKRKQALAEGLDEGALRTELEKRALTGDAEAALTLGLMLRYGEVTSNGAEATTGNGLRVEVMASGPDGELVRVSNLAAVAVPEQFAEAERLIRAAAEAGNARAMAELGRLLLADETRADGPAQAESWLRMAWAAGESEGAFLLASAQRMKLLEPTAGEGSMEMLLAAAEQGNDSARRLLIVANREGRLEGVTSEQVVRWTEVLATAGDKQAMYALGDRYRKLGNHEAAVAWFERAAANGNATATLELSTYGIGDQQVQLAAIEHLRVQLSSPSTADGGVRYTLALLLADQPDTETNRAEILRLLGEAAEKMNYQAALAARMILDGSTPKTALAAMIGVDDATAYARNLQAKTDATTQVDPETGLPLNARPKPIDVPRPDYPVELLAAKTDGNVTVQFFIDETGAVSDPQVLSSDHPAFSAAALEALTRWRFTPGIKDGRVVATRTQISFPFSTQK